jgi:hypothetical protein
MEWILDRQFFNDGKSSIGMWMDPLAGTRLFWTLEDTDRGLHSQMSDEEIKAIKVPHLTAIPYGRYEIIISLSPRFGVEMPELLSVKGFTGIRIHPGNYPRDTDGCILPGQGRGPGEVYHSQRAYRQFLPVLREALSHGPCFVEITKWRWKVDPITNQILGLT